MKGPASADRRQTPELRLDAKIEAAEAVIIKWTFGTIGSQTLISLGAVIALTRTIKPQRSAATDLGRIG